MDFWQVFALNLSCQWLIGYETERKIRQQPKSGVAKFYFMGAGNNKSRTSRVIGSSFFSTGLIWKPSCFNTLFFGLRRQIGRLYCIRKKMCNSDHHTCHFFLMLIYYSNGIPVYCFKFEIHLIEVSCT